MQFKTKLKRVIARMLIFCMMFSMVQSFAGIEAQAATELDIDTDMKANHSGLTTAYKWAQNGVGKFDIQGIQDASRIGQPDPYIANRSQAVITTYNFQGYETLVQQSNGANSTNINIATNGGVQDISELGIEVQMKVYPSADQKWILVDYILYNKTAAANSVRIASGTDVQVGGISGGGASDPADASALYLNDRGFHMVNQSTLQSFSCITESGDPTGAALGVTTTTSRWGGKYGSRTSYYFTDLPTSVPNSSQGQYTDANGYRYVEGVDSGITYSWTVPLQPFETVTKRVAFGAKGPSYYVNSGVGADVAGKGTYDEPFKTIEYALTTLGSKMGYIYIQQYGELTNTINVGGNVTFMSADYNTSGQPIGDIVTLKRAASYISGPMFQTSGTGTMRFSDLVLDGNIAATGNDHPILKAASGTVGILSGAVLQNNKVAGLTSGSAIDVTGTANLEMNYGIVQANRSGAKGAINFDSSGHFKIQNEIKIVSNTLLDNLTYANVYLKSGTKMIAVGDLEGMAIGVTTESLPDASDPSADPTPAAGMVVLAEGETASINASVYTDQFTADQASAGVRISNDGTKVVLKRDGLELTKEYQNEQGATIMPTETVFYAKDQAVNESPTALLPTLSGYALLRTEIDPAGLSHDAAGTVTGTMPNSSVSVVYVYEQIGASIAFIPNGGSPAPSTLIGLAGDPVTGMLPTVSRYGYDFGGWHDRADFTGLEYTALPTHYTPAPLTLYAKWVPNSSITFGYNAKYVNASGAITFDTDGPFQYPVETILHAEAKAVPGYKVINKAAMPSSAGGFNAIHEFDGLMPDQDVLITYTYGVDYGVTKQPLVIKYKSDLGIELNTATTTGYYPEDNFSAIPKEIYGYDLQGGAVTGGQNPGYLTYPVTGAFDSANRYTGVMPNQAVEITYTYVSNGSGYDYVVNNIDLTNGSDIIQPIVASKPAEVAVTATFEDFYGYLFASHNDSPAVGNFNGAHHYTAQMPNQDLTVNYNYNRDPSLWKTITYQPGIHGTLNNTDISSAVTQVGSTGKYQTEFIYHNGTTAADNGAHTWSGLGVRNLIPNAEANQYYQFGGWFIDTDGDRIKGQHEPYLTSDQQFDGPVTVTADFIEDPAWWIDINFAADSRGNLTSTPTTLHLVKGTTWADLEAALMIPTYQAQTNYIFARWTVAGTTVTSDRVLEHGKTYVVNFKPDPNVFGTDLQAPQGTGGVDVDGSGMLTVHGTGDGYKYIVTDKDGKIVAIQSGSDVSSDLVFRDLDPGNFYHIYEADGSTTATVGDSIDVVTDKSDKTEVLVPVVENNVSVLYDEETDGKVKIVINPADPDTDYALIDKDGNVVIIPGAGADGWVTPSGSNPSTVVFPGLRPNEDYTIVGKPHGKTGVTPLDKLPEGSVINTDPIGELDIPYYIIETIGGEIVSVGDETINANYYDEAEKDDVVSLHAASTDNSGNEFKYWKVLVGGGFAGKITSRDITFVMPETNVVICAYYDRVASAGNANVEEEVRGGNENEMAINPDEYERLEEELTTPEDRDIINVNGAKVTYKIVFNKNRVKSEELTATKLMSAAFADHPDAYTGAWGLDINLERYINGRKVGLATASNASFDVIVQLDKEDVDMMDYELYQITDDGFGNLNASIVHPDGDIEQNFGLFHFAADVNSRYVLVYSKAYKVTVVNEVVPPAYYKRFKVRKGEAIDEIYYQTDYDEILDQDAEWSASYEWIDTQGNKHNWHDKDGVWHDYVGFSSRSMPARYKEYEFDALIKKPTVIYAYYKNNRPELLAKREELEQAIKDAIKLSKDYNLTVKETEELREIIKKAQEVFNQTEPRKANYDELQDAIDQLKRETKPYEDITNGRQEEYENIHNNGNSSTGGGSGGRGGSGGGGGSGRGTVAKPYVQEKSKTYTVGVNGNWDHVDGSERWAFTLNGGIRLKGMWAWLSYSDGEMQKTGWYHFNSFGIMDDGWFRDEANNWYYCDTAHDGGFGKMKSGWHYDQGDKHWYYLDPDTGMMATGWKEIDGKWYFFTAVNYADTYQYDAANESWAFMNVTSRPLGSMFVSESTPDGYQIDSNGVWNR